MRPVAVWVPSETVQVSVPVPSAKPSAHAAVQVTVAPGCRPGFQTEQPGRSASAIQHAVPAGWPAHVGPARNDSPVRESLPADRRESAPGAPETPPPVATEPGTEPRSLDKRTSETYHGRSFEQMRGVGASSPSARDPEIPFLHLVRGTEQKGNAVAASEASSAGLVREPGGERPNGLQPALLPSGAR